MFGKAMFWFLLLALLLVAVVGGVVMFDGVKEYGNRPLVWEYVRPFEIISYESPQMAVRIS